MKRLAVLALLALASCESAEAPAACGPIPDATVNAGETTTAAACFNDPNGDVLSYSVRSSDPGVATASLSNATVTVTAVAPGDATVTVTASDPGGLAATQTFHVTVPHRPQRLTNEGGELPVWSPDGDRIAFLSHRNERDVFDIYVMDADGDNEERLTDSGGELPAWSPDADRIAFHSDRAGDEREFDIYVIQINLGYS